VDVCFGLNIMDVSSGIGLKRLETVPVLWPNLSGLD